MAMPIKWTGIFGNRFIIGPRKRVANANSASLSDTPPVSPKKQRFNALLQKAEKYSQLLNDSTRFRQSPSYIKGELRDYQIQALNWLVSLYENKIGGILADEMGLGKTVQSIAILGYLKYYKHINGPFLIVGTKSMMSSWAHEFKKFCPAMKVVELTGDKHYRATLIVNMEANPTKWNVCLTTFETILLEPFLRRHRWKYVVIDEGHRLKNEKSVFSKLIREVRSNNRLLLTGTPLQNNLHELWTLLNYLMPDIFDKTEMFDSIDDENSMKCIKAILHPFFLRRVKADVEGSLLPKIEHKLFVGLTRLQRDTYITTIQESRNNSKSDKLHKLRQIANHPYLIEGVEPSSPYEDHGTHLINTSGKMMVLDKLLIGLNASGSRVLLFSQSADMLDIIEDYLDWRKYSYRRLDGRTSYTNRTNDIDEFNAPSSRIFIYILSTHAGALGINLQRADAVIIFDSDWNPLIDLQAIDRAHRIGQKKQVHVYRLIAENTVDECIVLRADVKLHLNNMMIERGCVFENSKVAGGVKNKVLRFGVKAITAVDAVGITDVNMSALFRYSEQKSAEIALTLKNMNENELRNAGFEVPATNAQSIWRRNNLYRLRMPYSDPNGVNQSHSSSIQPIPNYSQVNMSETQFPLDDPLVSEENVEFITASTQSEATRTPSPSVHLKVESTAATETAPAIPPQSEATRTPATSVHLKLEPTAATETAPLSSIHLNVYQFYPVQLIEKCSGNRMLDLCNETELKMYLIAQGFPNWLWTDYKTFCDAVQKYGRFDLSNVAQMMMPSKNFDEVVKYHEQFFGRGPAESAEILSIWNKIIFEEKLNQQRNEAFKWKMLQTEVTQPVDSRLRHEKFTALHDKYLVSAISRYELAFNICNRIIADIRFHSDFGFFTTIQFGMMTGQEITDRINHLVSAVQNEYLAAFTEITMDDDKKPESEQLV